MQIAQDTSTLHQIIRQYPPTSKTALVPTMGALHVGHEALIAQARCQADHVIVSIFVNPLQFAPQEDLSRYPRTLEEDLSACRQQQVDLVFVPDVPALYGSYNPPQMCTVQPAPALEACLCGLSRPQLFAGALTVVLKLLNLIRPTQAYFGEKDYQQMLLMRRMCRDFDLDTEIIAVPTVREESGLAYSSRNQYLNASQREQASTIAKALKLASHDIENGRPVLEAIAEYRELLLGALDSLEYFEARHPETLELVEQGPLRLFVAGWLSQTRLIDNWAVKNPPERVGA